MVRRGVRQEVGEKHDNEVIVHHIVQYRAQHARGRRVSAKRHDLFMFLSPPAAFEQQTYRHDARVSGRSKEAREDGRPRPQVDIQSQDQAVLRFRTRTSDPGITQGVVNRGRVSQGPRYLGGPAKGAKKIRDKNGHPCGWALAGARYQHGAARAAVVVRRRRAGRGRQVVINSKETIEALKYMKALYTESQTAEVFTWDPSRTIGDARRPGVVVQNAISVTRTAERTRIDPRKIGLCKALKARPAGSPPST